MTKHSPTYHSQCSRKKSRFLSWLLPLVTTIGCTTVGPDYSGPPEVDVPQEWAHMQQSTRPSVRLEQWWRHFDDPMLQQLIEQLNQDNLQLKISALQMLESQLNLGISSSQYYPTVNSQGQYGRQQLSSNQFFGLPTGARTQESLNLGFAWELDVFGRIARQVEAASAAVAISQEQYHDLQVVLNARAASLYVQIRTLQERLAWAQKNVAIQRETMAIVMARFKAELVSELDVTRAEQNLARSESALPQLQAQLYQRQNQLSVLLGAAPGSLQQQLSITKPLPSLKSELVLSIPRDVLRQRPDIRMAEQQLAAQSALIGVAKADLYPRFSLAGLFGFATISGNLNSSGSKHWSLAPGFNWELFSAGRKQNQVKIAETRLQQATHQYQQTVLNALQDVENSLSHYQRQQQHLAHLRVSVAAANETAKLVRAQYRSGLTNFQSVLDAERVLFTEEDNLAVNKGLSALQLISIYRALGGGWTPVPYALNTPDTSATGTSAAIKENNQ